MAWFSCIFATAAVDAVVVVDIAIAIATVKTMWYTHAGCVNIS